MFNRNKIISFALAFLLLLTAIPVLSIAQGEEVQENPEQVATAGAEEQIPEEPVPEEPVPEKPADAPGDTKAEDEFIYNLGKLEVTVALDGDYTIQLEDNAFFPYEIQFKYDGRTWVETLEDLDETVEIGGCDISFESDYSDDAISQIGVYVGGEYIAAKPEPKEFTNSNGIMPFSLLPVVTDNTLTLDLTDLTPEQTQAVQVSARTVIAGETGGKTVMWNYAGPDYSTSRDYDNDDDYIRLTDDTYDMIRVSGFTMRVGTGNQLDYSGIKYHVSVNRNTLPTHSSFSLYDQTPDGTRTNIVRGRGTRIDRANIRNQIVYIDPRYPAVAEYYLIMDYNYSYSASYNVDVYKGHFDSAAAALSSGAENIADQIYDQNDYEPDVGYKANFSAAQPFTVFVTFGGSVIYQQKYTVTAVLETEPGYVSYDRIFEEGVDNYYDPPRRIDVGYIRSSEVDEYTGVEILTAELDSGRIADSEYYINFFYYDYATGGYNNSKITRAVLGHYDTPAAAAQRPDISASLIKTPDEMNAAGAGYKANYKDGVKFTIVADGQVNKYTVFATEEPGSGDTSFSVDGATGVDYGDIYKMPVKDDSGAGQFGYQVLLINDKDADLTALEPIFYTAQGLDAYVDGVKQTSGVTPQDFSNGAVQYVARAENGEDVKNYWVTFVKKATGPKLFVVVDGEKPDTREVYLDSHTENHHDIFLANVGDADLTGLSVSLENAVNIKLSDYWNIKPNTENTLEAFSTTNDGTYGELPNIAKMRLLPVADGPVSGTLKITSDDGEYTIKIVGEAGDPKITTTQAQLDANPAVQYVPYSFMLTTNNKYEWNKTTFYWYDGDLPDGVIIRPSGEIYGIPTETGTFDFTVTLEHSGPFAYKDYDFTLTVIGNSNANVASTWEPGYEITQFVTGTHGGVLTAYADAIFETEGPFQDFIDFWIDGEKQTRGVDYTAEEGSTVITIRAQTFQRFGTGTHTIAAEFRDAGGDRDEALHRAAQNYTVAGATGPVPDPGDDNNNDDDDDDNDSSGGGSGGSASLAGTSGATAALPTLSTKMRNAGPLSLADLRRIAQLAAGEGATPRLIVDTMSGNGVDVRVSINPALATGDMNLAGWTNNQNAARTRALFERYFANEFPAVINLGQKGGFGQPATICVKVPQGTVVEDLVFYSYDSATNKYSRIQLTNAFIDANGYLHFTTTLANDIVVSVGELTPK